MSQQLHDRSTSIYFPECKRDACCRYSCSSVEHSVFEGAQSSFPTLIYETNETKSFRVKYHCRINTLDEVSLFWTSSPLSAEALLLSHVRVPISTARQVKSARQQRKPKECQHKGLRHTCRPSLGHGTAPLNTAHRQKRIVFGRGAHPHSGPLQTEGA